jgi:hypothetical protein
VSFQDLCSLADVRGWSVAVYGAENDRGALLLTGLAVYPGRILKQDKPTPIARAVLKNRSIDQASYTCLQQLKARQHL